MTFKSKEHWRHSAAGYCRWDPVKAKQIVDEHLKMEAAEMLIGIEIKLAAALLNRLKERSEQQQQRSEHAWRKQEHVVRLRTAPLAVCGCHGECGISGSGWRAATAQLRAAKPPSPTSPLSAAQWMRRHPVVMEMHGGSVPRCVERLQSFVLPLDQLLEAKDVAALAKWMSSVPFDNLRVMELGLNGPRVWQSSVRKPSCFRAHFGICHTDDMNPLARARARVDGHSLLDCYPVHFCGHTAEFWYARHVPKLLGQAVLSVHAGLRHLLPPRAQVEPPNSFVLLRYDEDNGKTAAEMNLHHDHRPIDGQSAEAVAQVQETPVIQITLSGEMMLWISELLENGKYGAQHLAAVLRAGSVFVWMPLDDYNYKHGVFWNAEPTSPAGEHPDLPDHRVRYVLLLRWVHFRDMFSSPSVNALEPVSPLSVAPRPLSDGGCPGCVFTKRYAGVGKEQ
jgi:hypothetical protein